MSIPQQELDIVVRSIQEHPEYFDTDFIYSSFHTLGLEVIQDPFSKEIINKIIHALEHEQPYSVIRIGDGEANILTYGHYPETPYLNKWVFKKIIALQQDAFSLSESWMLQLQELMLDSIKEADIIGVTGLWRPKKVSAKLIESMFIDNKYRGVSGHWRAIDYLLEIAPQSFFKTKTIASAHLYFSLLEHLSEILTSTKKLLVLSDKETVISQLKMQHPDLTVEYIPVGSRSNKNNDSPDFLFQIKQQLPTDLSGCLCLIGAGPWTEVYCTWIKQRGGVAVDLGSGFDLLGGEITRPIHKLLNQSKLGKYIL